jgi:hypothetical protein
VLKATGDGLSRPMRDLHVSPPAAAPMLLGLAGDAPPACQLADISVGAGYLGCVAVLTPDPVAVQTLTARDLLARA